MKKLFALALAASTLSPALAQTSVGVSIGINQPGVYGQINIGNLPPPPVVYAQPIIYAPPRVAVVSARRRREGPTACAVVLCAGGSACGGRARAGIR